MKVSLDGPALEPFEIRVDFGPAIHGDAQGRCLIALERYLRETLGVPALVYKATMGDDSKLRRSMTEEERRRL